MLTAEQILSSKMDIALSELRDALIGAGDEAKTLNDLATLIGALNTEAVTDPNSTTATLIELVKGFLKQLQGNGSGATPVRIAGSDAIKGDLASVAAAGTRVRLPDYPCQEVTVIARRANTGNIYVGGSDVSSAIYGVNLSAEQSFTFVVSNSNLLYIDASVDGEGVSYVAI